MIAKLKALCGHSLTVAVSYGIMALGTVLQYLDTFSVFITDQDVNTMVSSFLGADSKLLGKYMAGVGLVTLLARLRSLWKVTHV